MIPTEIGLCTGLSWLSLKENALDGSIPTELGCLSLLDSLLLHQNALNGTLPIELAPVTALKALHLHFNYLTGSLPSEIGLWTNMGKYYLSLLEQSSYSICSANLVDNLCRHPILRWEQLERKHSIRSGTNDQVNRSPIIRYWNEWGNPK